jgi:hypothetical protein
MWSLKRCLPAGTLCSTSAAQTNVLVIFSKAKMWSPPTSSGRKCSVSCYAGLTSTIQITLQTRQVHLHHQATTTGQWEAILTLTTTWTTTMADQWELLHVCHLQTIAPHRRLLEMVISQTHQMSNRRTHTINCVIRHQRSPVAPNAQLPARRQHRQRRRTLTPRQTMTIHRCARLHNQLARHQHQVHLHNLDPHLDVLGTRLRLPLQALVDLRETQCQQIATQTTSALWTRIGHT